MPEILSLPYEIQIVLVAGYLGYKISRSGRGVQLGVEEIILQVLAFGLVARLIALAISALINLPPLPVSAATTAPTQNPSTTLNFEWSIVAVALFTLSAGIIAGMLWRGWLSEAISNLMGRIKVYRDDNEGSTWQSITNAKAKWSFIQIHLKNGKVLEAWFKALPKNPVKAALLLNDDGIATYVTRIYDADGTPRDTEIAGGNSEEILTYIPRSQIEQIDLGWKRL